MFGAGLLPKSANKYLRERAAAEKQMVTDVALIPRTPEQIENRIASILQNFTRETQITKAMFEISDQIRAAEGNLNSEFQTQGATIKRIVGYQHVQLPKDKEERKAGLQAAFQSTREKGGIAIASDQRIEGGLKLWEMLLAYIPISRQAIHAFRDKDHAVVMRFGKNKGHANFSHLVKESRYKDPGILILPLRLSTEIVWASKPSILKTRQIGEGAKEISGKTVVNELLGENNTKYLHPFKQTKKIGKVVADQVNTSLFIPLGPCLDYLCQACYDLYQFQNGPINYSRYYKTG
jgi:hypothetical protein